MVKIMRMRHAGVLMVIGAVGLMVSLGVTLNLYTASQPNPSKYLRMFKEQSDVDNNCHNTEGKTTCPSGFDSSPLVLVSMDGFRADYIIKSNDTLTPKLLHLLYCGVSGVMRPVFPSISLTNLISIITGRNPDQHGIVDKVMFNRQFNETFVADNDKFLQFDSKWLNSKPLWSVAMESGVKTAAMDWPGSLNTGSTPTYTIPYNTSLSIADYFSTILHWLDMPAETRPQLITVHINEPGDTIRQYGVSPGTEESKLRLKLKELDDEIGLFVAELRHRGLLGCVNLMFVSPSGMSDVNCTQTLNLAETVTVDDDTFTRQGTMGRVNRYSSEYTDVETEQIIDSLSCTPHFITNHKHLIPVRLHYSNNDNIDDVIVLPDQDWLVSRESQIAEPCITAVNGYDNALPDMGSVVVGHGPAFRQGVVLPTTVPNNELHNLMCDLLSLPCVGDNDGHIGALDPALVSPPPRPQQSPLAASRCEDFPQSVVQYLTVVGELQNTDACQSQVPMAVDYQLKLSDAEMKSSQLQHAPAGLPSSQQPHINFCTLTQRSYITGYSTNHTMPLWVSYTLTKGGDVVNVGAGGVRPDVRITAADQPPCYQDMGQDDVTLGYLSNPEHAADDFDVFDFLISTNSVPVYEMFSNFRSIGSALLNSDLHVVELLNGVNVITGPVFDYDRDGLPDIDIADHNRVGGVPIPSHFFKVFAYCSSGSRVELCKSDDLIAAGFIVPHTNDLIYNCMDLADYQRHHTASVADIETVTGLTFLPELSLLTKLQYLPDSFPSLE